MTYLSFGEGKTAFVWAHGWGHDHTAFLGLAQGLSFMGKHYLIDFPGFGGSPKPSADWHVKDYADFAKAFVDSLPEKDVIWIGHSFGCRVGIKLAAIGYDKIARYVLVAAHGLPRYRSPLNRLRFYLQIRLYKFLKLFVQFSPTLLNLLRKRFGSADYNNAGPMRQIFLNVINENLQEDAAKIDQPVLLIYGSKDNETPPEIGQRFSKLMRNAQLRVLGDFDHYSILTSAKHQVSQLIKNFVQE